MTKYVWYACYGSNLLMQRFLCYIEGGTAPGGLLSNPGARNTALPTDIRPYKIDRPLYFGERSEQWQDGGVAFLEQRPVPDRWSLGRIYKITNDQFDDVVLQENGLEPGLTTGMIPRPDPGESSVIFDSFYGRILCLEIFEGSPVYTFTRSSDIPQKQRTRPSPQYLTTIIAGLMETWPNLSNNETIEYLMSTEAKEIGVGEIQKIITNLESGK